MQHHGSRICERLVQKWKDWPFVTEWSGQSFISREDSVKGTSIGRLEAWLMGKKKGLFYVCSFSWSREIKQTRSSAEWYRREVLQVWRGNRKLKSKKCSREGACFLLQKEETNFQRNRWVRACRILW